MGWLLLILIAWTGFLILIIDDVDSSNSMQYSIVTGISLMATIYAFIGRCFG